MRVLAESTITTSAPPEAVWAVWTDAGLRPEWHPGIAWMRFDGPVEVGTTGAFKPHKARRPVDLVVAEAEPQRRLVLRGTHTKGWDPAQGHYVHTVEPAPGGGSTITQSVALSGILAAPIGRLLGGMLGVSANLQAVADVARLAEAR